MRICEGCGKQLPSNAVTCSHCGHGFNEEKVTQIDERKVEEFTQNMQEKVEKVRKPIMILSGLPFFIIGMLMIFSPIQNYIDKTKHTVDVNAIYKDSINCKMSDTIEYCDIVYKYEVNSKEYEYTMIYVNSTNVPDEINLLYNEKNPSSAILEDNKEFDVIQLIMGIIFVLVAIAAMNGKAGNPRIRVS